MSVVFLVIAAAGLMPSTVAFFTICAREKRVPSIIFMIELIGRWFQLKSERRDIWVSVAVLGYLVGSVCVIAAIAVFN